LKGKQHFQNMSFFLNAHSQEDGRSRDMKKTDLCKQHGFSHLLTSSQKVGITLIEVPYWWNRKSSSLEATIYTHRPDLFTERPSEAPIALTAPTTQPKSESPKYMFFFLIR
jgi:hypothetical protein